MRKFLFIALLLTLAFSAAPTLAQRASIALVPVWRPGEQLTTDTSSDDFRYVDIELQMTGNVQFWAVNLVCAFTPSVLEGYDVNVINGDPGDDVPMVTFGPEWGTQGGDFVAVSNSGDGFDYDPATGRLTLTATRLGNVASLGVNGADYNLLLATVRLRVKDLGTDVLARTATVNCATREFLNRDGRVVVRASQARTPALSVRTGYQISGKALLQAARSHAGINVTCTDSALQQHTSTTSAKGDFVIGNNNLIREFGPYSCEFVGPNADPQAEFLDARVELYLNGFSHYLLPVTLKAGNVNVAAGSENEIDEIDLADFTTSWSPRSVPTAYDEEDVNGDRRIDQADLSIFAGNYAPGAAGDTDTPIDTSHMLFGLATDLGGTFPNSRIYWGDTTAGPVTQLVNPGRERDFWPAMSPDGETIALIRVISRSGQMVLYTGATANPRPRALTPSRGFTRDALAPSWSPDGQRIAFICSNTDPGVSGYEFNEGDICVIDANGANLRVVATHSRVFPPAWFDNNVILYGGQSDHFDTQCRNTLCFIDLATNASGRVSDNLVFAGSDIVDMPAISTYDHDLNLATPNRQALFYRWGDGSTKNIRVTEILYDGAGMFTVSPFNVGTHNTAASPSAAGLMIDYYHVSPFMDLVYYESTITNGVFQTTNVFYNRPFINNILTGWNTVTTHHVDGFVGNITATSGPGAGLPWNGSENTATLFHAQRATVQWIP